MDEQDANVEYGYCFSVNEDYAVDVLKADGSDDLEQKLTDAGFEPVRPEEMCIRDRDRRMRAAQPTR